MPCSLYNRSRLIAYLYHQAVQLLGSTAIPIILRQYQANGLATP